MTEDKLHQLFQELNQEATEVPVSQISDWVNTKPTGFQFKITYLIIGLSLLILLSFIFLQREKTPLVFKNAQRAKVQINPIIPSTPLSSANQQNEIIVNQTHDKNKDTENILNQTETFNFDKLPFKSIKTYQEQIPNRPNKSKKWLSDLVAIKNAKSEVIFDSLIPQQNTLLILDSVQLYRSNKRLRMDENDCYLQILNDYVVISYRFRGSTVFKSGKIYETGIMQFEGEDIRVYGFIVDNRYSPSNFGQRNFFGIKESDSTNSEVVIFGFNWNPLSTLKAHPASDQERNGLIERSNKQKNL
jgi:hypothetical protein